MYFSVTYGYALQQCVRESVLGGLVAISAVIGILGSIAFPFLRKKLNVTRYTNFSVLSFVLVIDLYVCVPGLE